MKGFCNCMLFAGIFPHLAIASTMSCQETQENIINATSQIKANHQSISSFNLFEQQQFLKKDQLILNDNNYPNSVSYLTTSCTNN